MSDKTISGENHLRTIIKTICYRVVSILTAIFLTIFLGGNLLQAITMGSIVLIVGTLHYYIYDRLWLLISWERDTNGKDRNDCLGNR